MTGKHRVVVKNNRLHYEFEIKRNIVYARTLSEKGNSIRTPIIAGPVRVSESGNGLVF